MVINIPQKTHLLIAKVVLLSGYRSHQVDLHWLIYAQRFIPPKIINNTIKASQRKCDELKFSDGEPLDAACNAMDDEPTTLQDSDGF